MDELALLKAFRAEDAAPNHVREHARAALQRAMTRRRFFERGYAIVVAVAAAALLAAGAYAIVREFVIGSPAPADVSKDISAIVGATAHVGVPGTVAQQVVGAPRVAAGADTSWGPMYLVVAKLRGGAACRFRVLPGDKPLGPASEVLGGGAECTRPAHPPTLSFGLTTVQRLGRERSRSYRATRPAPPASASATRPTRHRLPGSSPSTRDPSR